MAIEELPKAPNLAVLYGKAAAGLRRRGRSGDAIPDTELQVRQVPVDRARLVDYNRVCRFRLTDALPPTYPRVLAFPLALELLTRPEFPLPAAGLVHTANRIELRRAIQVEQPLDLAVRAQELREHPRGYEVDVRSTATVDGVEVWREVSTYLHRRRSDGPAPHPVHSEPPAPTAVWRIDKQVNAAYAAVSGDHNPIHTSTLAARAFGFRGRIAHGMWTMARCLAQLAARLPAPPYLVEVSFRSPIVLPATVGFGATPDEHGWTFAVHDRATGRPHLYGTLSGKVTRE
jgi:acyl dehydratase